jgi:hypothetical protein
MEPLFDEQSPDDSLVNSEGAAKPADDESNLSRGFFYKLTHRRKACESQPPLREHYFSNAFSEAC